MLSIDLRRGRFALAALVATFAVITSGLYAGEAAASDACVPSSDLLSTSATEASCFEGFDGNQVSDHPALGEPHIDWEDLVGDAGLVTVRDDTGDSTFSGGDKENDPGKWAFNPAGSAQNKVDVLAVATNTDTVAGDTFVYGAFERLTSTGDVFLSFEMNQIAATFDHDNNAVTQEIPERSEGDALITFSGNQGNINIYMCRWHGDGLGETTDSAYGWYELPGFGEPDPDDGGATLTDKASGSDGCTLLDTNTSPAAAGEMNNGAMDNYIPRFGGPAPLPADGSGAPNTIADEEFGEMVINLDNAVQLGGAANPCFAFGSIWIHTRASHSFTNSMEDLTAPTTVNNASNCTMAIAKTVAVNQSSTPPADNTFADSASALTGDTLHYRLAVTNTGQEPISDVVVTDPLCTSTPTLDASAQTADGELDVGETWIYRCARVYGAADNTIVNTGTAKGQVGTGTCPAAAGSTTLKCLEATDTATVTRGVPPCTATAITAHPQSQTITYGADATFTATASGSPAPTVQWQVSTMGALGPWTNVPGATTTTLTVAKPTVAQSGSLYRAVFENPCGTATSDNALLTVNPKAVPGTCTVADKVYDGTTAATVTSSLLGAGVIPGDVVSLDATNASSVFPDPDVGNGKPVPCNGFALSGADAANYTLTMSATTASITPKALTGSCTVENKVYDGTNAATISGSALGAGVVAGDDVSLSGGSSTFADENVGDNKPATCAGFTLTGPDAANYTLTMSNTTGNITPKALTGTCTVANKVYDGTTSATVTGSSLAGAVAGDAVSLNGSGASSAFGDPNVGNGKATPCNGFALSGADAGNYTLTMSPTQANITPKPLTGACTAADKAFDGNTTATVTGTSLNGVVGSDDVTLGGGSATFDDPDPGRNKPVDCKGFTLAGADKGNYTVSVDDTNATIQRPPRPAVDSCLRRPVFAFIRGGQQTQRVVFFLDGEKYGTVTNPFSGGRFGVHVDRRKLGPGTHTLSATIYFTRASQRKPLKLIVVKLKPCLAANVPADISVPDLPTARCVSKAFLAFVKGDTISTVTYSLNGKRLRNLSVADGSGRYKVRISPAQLRPGKNVLKAKIVFIRGSKTKNLILERKVRGCA